MKQLFILCCVLSLSCALKDKKINLHDIERETLANEKKLKQERTTQAPKLFLTPYVHPQNIAPSPTHYGFLAPGPGPVKTAQHYIQPQTTQQYSLPLQQYYALQQPQVQPYREQQYAQYQQYENIPYVSDNNIPQQPQQPYYTPQYVYVQPYAAASTSVPSVVPPKGGVQYVMYIPTPTYVQAVKAEQTQNYENVVPAQAYVNVLPQSYTPESRIYPDQQTPSTETQYTTQYVTQTQPQKFVQYVQPQAKYVTSKRGPQSLLESYVPSALQLQYYKQQQNEINAIRESIKVSPPVAGKTEYVKPAYRIPHPSQSEAESTFTYTYQLPSYSQYGIK